MSALFGLAMGLCAGIPLGAAGMLWRLSVDRRRFEQQNSAYERSANQSMRWMQGKSRAA